MKAYCQISEIFYYEGDPMDPGGNMMLKCNFPGMLKLSIVWQKNVHIKIAKSSYKAAFIYATKICHRKQCALCGNIFRKSSNPRIHKFMKETVCLLWKYSQKFLQSQNTYKKSS